MRRQKKNAAELTKIFPNEQWAEHEGAACIPTGKRTNQRMLSERLSQLHARKGNFPKNLLRRLVSVKSVKENERDGKQS